jgi:hypothetical protein
LALALTMTTIEAATMPTIEAVRPLAQRDTIFQSGPGTDRFRILEASTLVPSSSQTPMIPVLLPPFRRYGQGRRIRMRSFVRRHARQRSRELFDEADDGVGTTRATFDASTNFGAPPNFAAPQGYHWLKLQPDLTSIRSRADSMNGLLIGVKTREVPIP